MFFYEKDLDLNNDLKGSFLKLLPGKLEQFLRYMEKSFSHAALLGPVIDTLTADCTAGGVAAINYPERFTIGMKVQLYKSTPTGADAYVIAVDMNNKTITLSDSRGGAAFNFSAYTVALDAKIYMDGTLSVAGGVEQNSFNNLKSALLSAANGGSASLHNQTKTSYPFLQAKNIDGSGFTKDTILEDLFDSIYETASWGKGMPSEIIVSFRTFKHAVKNLELNRQFSREDVSAGYGFRSIKILGPDGALTLTAIREMDNDIAIIMDWSAVELAGSHFFDRKRHGNNEEYFMSRATTGYTYIVDIRLFGNIIVKRPSYCGIVHSIDLE